MALGIVKNDEFEAELSRLENPQPTASIIQMPSRGRKEGDNNVPDELRRIISDTHVTDGPAEANRLAGSFGISPSSVSAYAHGATSTSSYNNPTPSLKGTVDNATDRIISKAKHRIRKAISHITDEKLKEAKPLDLSTIARNLGAVVRNLEPEKPAGQVGNGPTFVFYTPPQRKEEAYDVIVLKE